MGTEKQVEGRLGVEWVQRYYLIWEAGERPQGNLRLPGSPCGLSGVMAVGRGRQDPRHVDGCQPCGPFPEGRPYAPKVGVWVEDVAVGSSLGVGSLQSQDQEGSGVGCGWRGQECRATLGLAGAGRTELSLSEMGTPVGRRTGHWKEMGYTPTAQWTR